MTKPFVSVIIPVYNDSVRLKKCLDALEQQTYENGLYEVIVVDNGSREDIKGILEQFTHAVFAHESTPGSFFARNKGVSMAKGDMVAFTDSDCIPAPDWIEKGIAKLLEIPGCGLVAGKVEVFLRDQKNPTTVELYERTVAYQQERYIRENKQGITANIFTRKEVFDKVGFFNAELLEMADYEWGRRVFSYGYEVVYADDARVSHPARYTLSELYKKVSRIADGYYRLEKKNIRSFKDFIYTLSRYFQITYKDIFLALSDKRLKGRLRRIKVVLVILFVRLVYVYERLRLALGGTPKR